MPELVPVLSLAVAALAVFVGPIVSWLIAKRQIAASTAVADKQVTAPMRQAWINTLREQLADLTARLSHCRASGCRYRSDDERRELLLIQQKITLLLNPGEDDHRQLVTLIHSAISLLSEGHDADDEFHRAYDKLMELSRIVLKREWNRVKESIKVG